MNALKFRSSTYLLISILGLAAILRLSQIDQPFIDYIDWRQADDAIIADNFYSGNWNILYPETSWNGPGKSYLGMEFQTISYATALLYLILGQHDWVGRAVAVVFGLWGIFALFKLVDRIWDRDHAIVSAAVMAVLPGSVFVDRSFIPDPVMVSLVVTSLWLLVIHLQTGLRRYLILGCVVGSLGYLTKISGLIVGIPLTYALVTILQGRGKLKVDNLAKVGIPILISLIPVAAYYFWAWHISKNYTPYYLAGTGWIWENNFGYWLKEKYFLPLLYWEFNNWLWTKPVTVLLVTGLLLGSPRSDRYYASENRENGRNFDAPWFFHWWMFAGVIYYIIGAKELMTNPWNFHIINPAVAALVARATIYIAKLLNGLTRFPAFYPTVTAIFALIFVTSLENYETLYNPPWHSKDLYELGLSLREISSPDDLVITMIGSGSPVAIYYSKRRGWFFPPPGANNWPEILKNDQMAIEIFEELRNKGAVYLGMLNDYKLKLTEKTPRFMEHIEKTCELKKKDATWSIYRILKPDEIKSQKSRNIFKRVN
jgi:4-amino-4-deoxy-L-arabinose transferase-like glycosyltransferase